MSQQNEPWDKLESAAKRAGWKVEDDGMSVEFSHGRVSRLFVKGRRISNKAGSLTNYEAACEMLKGFEVQIPQEER